jgi:hypothetical protein
MPALERSRGAGHELAGIGYAILAKVAPKYAALQ